MTTINDGILSIDKNDANLEKTISNIIDFIRFGSKICDKIQFMAMVILPPIISAMI